MAAAGGLQFTTHMPLRKAFNEACWSAGLAVAAAVLWAAVNELLIQPVEYTCFNLALEKVRCH